MKLSVAVAPERRRNQQLGSEPSSYRGPWYEIAGWSGNRDPSRRRAVRPRAGVAGCLWTRPPNHHLTTLTHHYSMLPTPDVNAHIGRRATAVERGQEDISEVRADRRRVHDPPLPT